MTTLNLSRNKIKLWLIEKNFTNIFFTKLNKGILK